MHKQSRKSKKPAYANFSTFLEALPSKIKSERNFRKLLKLYMNKQDIKFLELLESSSDEEKLDFLDKALPLVEKQYHSSQFSDLDKTSIFFSHILVKIPTKKILSYVKSKLNTSDFKKSFFEAIDRGDIKTIVLSFIAHDLNLEHPEPLVNKYGMNALQYLAVLEDKNLIDFLIRFLNPHPFLSNVKTLPSLLTQNQEIKKLLKDYEMRILDELYNLEDTHREIIKGILYHGVDYELKAVLNSKIVDHDELLKFMINFVDEDVKNSFNIVNLLALDFLMKFSLAKGRENYSSYSFSTPFIDFHNKELFFKALYYGHLGVGKFSLEYIHELASEPGGYRLISLIRHYKDEFNLEDWIEKNNNEFWLSLILKDTSRNSMLFRDVIVNELKICPFLKVNGKSVFSPDPTFFNNEIREYVNKWKTIVEKDGDEMLEALKQSGFSERFDFSDPAFASLFIYLLQDENCSKGDALLSLIKGL